MPTEEFYAGQSNYIRKLNDLWDRATTSVFGTSTDSLSVTTGSKSFTTNTNLQFAAGSQVTITATADLSKYMSGQVTTYNQDTGAIVVNVTSVNGSGTFSSWSITLSGAMGATGAAGIADNLSIGTVTSGVAAASITGTSPNKFLNLTLQTGATGAAGAPNVLSIGTVTGGATASATITGTSPAQVLNLVLPKGDTGDTGATGATGLTARGAWNASTAYVTSPSVDWVTYAGSSYYRKVAGTTPTDPATDTTNWGVLALKGADGTGAVSSVTASAPLASTGGATPNITITQANGSTNGFLSSTDWNIFNGKQAALGYTPANKAGDTFTGAITATQFNGSGAGLTSIPNSALNNSSVTIGTTNVPLGSSVSGFYGLSALSLANNNSSTLVYITNDSSTAARYPSVTIRNYSGGFGGNPSIELQTARGDVTTPTSVLNGDTLGGVNTWGHNGTSFLGATRIDGIAESDFSTSVNAGLVFKTANNNVVTERMRISSDGKVGIGVVPTAFGGSFNIAGSFGVQSYNANDAASYHLRFYKNRNSSVYANTIVQNNDQLGAISFFGADGTTYKQGASIRGEVDGVGTVSGTSMPSRIIFSTSSNGSTTPTERMRIDSTGSTNISGNLGITTTDPFIYFTETDQTLPAGKFRLGVTGNAFYLDKNTAADGGYSTLARAFTVNSSGELLTTTPATATNNTVVATTAYTVARIAQDALLKTGGTLTGSVREAKTTMAANAIDCALGGYFSKTISGATTFTVNNVSAANSTTSFILDLTNGGSAAITWWSGVKWSGGTAPTLTAAGRDVLGFFTYDNGTTWTGLMLGKDVK